MSLTIVVEVFIKIMNSLVMTFEEDKSFMCLAALLCVEQFCRFENGGARSFFVSAFSSGKVLGKILPFGVNCQLQLAVLRKKREEGVKPTCFMLKMTLVPQTNHSQYSSPVELNNSTIGLHVSSMRTKKLAILSFCGLYDLWCRVAQWLKFWYTHKFILLKCLIFTFTGTV